MYRPRVIDFRSSLAPGSLGLCATDITTCCAYLNEAIDRLTNDPIAPDEGWWGGWAKIAFTVDRTQPFIIAPMEVSRIIAMDICTYPVRINNQFFEYLEFGPGFQPKGCTNANGVITNPSCSPTQAFERETVTTTYPLLSTPQYIRAYVADPADVGRTAIIQGSDANGQTVRFLDSLTGASGLGEKITFSSPFTDTANLFSDDVAIQKQNTFGSVQFFQVDATTGAESPLLVMEPLQQTALFRKYEVYGLPQGCCSVTGVPQGTFAPLQVLAMCRLEFGPVKSDSDYLGILNLPALKEECMSIKYSTMDMPAAQQLSTQHHINALRLLMGQLDSKLGKENTAIQRHIFGSDRLQLQPL